MTNKFDKVKTDKSQNKFSVVSKRKKLLTSEIKKVVGGKAYDKLRANHNEIFLIV